MRYELVSKEMRLKLIFFSIAFCFLLILFEIAIEIEKLLNGVESDNPGMSGPRSEIYLDEFSCDYVDSFLDIFTQN